MRQTTWTISELAREFDVTPRTIRFYEDQGIVSPARDGRNRVYTTRDRTRLKLALRGRRLGLQLSEIVALINLYDRSNASTTAQLRHYADTLDAHRRKLEQQRRDLDETLKEIRRQQADCEALLRARLDSAVHAGAPSSSPTAVAGVAPDPHLIAK
ncbi:MerR family DNA-binding transcriptional regulator [Castellaniella sp. MT123]|uniref:MerR family transcriptional regulator n=1 Tax=Castellaniella sp. MT123 TaxID=3140381 RepID=UPI0031F3C44D|nr:MerR family DNA-binding transcriptional regulator [Castellaniella sp.]